MNKKMTSQKIGFVCSIVQIILSVLCMAYNAVNHENVVIWIVFLCSGICFLASNISRNKSKENKEKSRNSDLPK